METSFIVGLGIFTHQMKRCKALTNSLHSLSLCISYDKIHCVKKCPYSGFFSSVSLRIQLQCGKLRTTKTLNSDTF